MNKSALIKGIEERNASTNIHFLSNENLGYQKDLNQIIRKRKEKEGSGLKTTPTEIRSPRAENTHQQWWIVDTALSRI